MPIHDLGYRQWQGRLIPQAARWCVIAETGMRLTWRNVWLRRLLMFAWLPGLYLAIAFFLLEQALAHPEMVRFASEFLSQFPQSGPVVAALNTGDPMQARHDGWAWILLTFFRYPQGYIMPLVVGLVAPPLIAQDVRSRAFLLYFSRPITRVEYIFGKLAVVSVCVMMITTAPALVLYLLGLLVSPPDLAVVASTWDIPLRIILATVVVTIPTTAMALAFSSLTTRTFYAAFAWFAVWVFGLVAYSIIWANVGYQTAQKWAPLSLYLTLREVQSWVFGLRPTFRTGVESYSVWPSVMVLVGLAVVSLAVLYRRISSPMRV